jgi:RES domain-containing protein
MIVWRISNHAALDGLGGLKASARWHTKGRRIVYCAPNPATALLEMLVQNELDPGNFPLSYKLLKIEIPDAISCEEVASANLSSDWKQRPDLTRRIGDDWLRAAKTALLAVPCVIVPETQNILIDPEHPDSSSIRIVETIRNPIDERLI